MFTPPANNDMALADAARNRMAGDAIGACLRDLITWSLAILALATLVAIFR